MKFLIVLLIRVYQRVISPLTPRCCRYFPTCSSYALGAVERFGAVRGLIMAAARLSRCHPWARGGIDEVPEEFRWTRISFFRVKEEADR